MITFVTNYDDWGMFFHDERLVDQGHKFALPGVIVDVLRYLEIDVQVWFVKEPGAFSHVTLDDIRPYVVG